MQAEEDRLVTLFVSGKINENKFDDYKLKFVEDKNKIKQRIIDCKEKIEQREAEQSAEGLYSSMKFKKDLLLNLDEKTQRTIIEKAVRKIHINFHPDRFDHSVLVELPSTIRIGKKSFQHLEFFMKDKETFLNGMFS